MPPAAALAFLAPLALAGASANSARPDTVAVRIRFEAPPGCAGGDDFYAAILARTEHARRALGDEDGVRLVVRLTRRDSRDGKIEGELRVIAGRGETDTRRVEGATCKEVVQGL